MPAREAAAEGKWDGEEMDPLFLGAAELAKKLIHLYYCERKAEEFLAYLDSAVTWVGCGEEEFSLNYGEIAKCFQRAEGRIPPCGIWDEEYRLAAAFADGCVVVGRFRAHTEEEAKMLLDVQQRVTFVFRLSGNALKVIHIHASNPHALRTGEVLPETAGKSTYDYLNYVIREKTEQIQVMLGAMTGGLKGSRDDETYSFFYVSDELCGMLGYTKAEFMEASGGSAVGMVYPPDLKDALEQCCACFLRGDSYAAEYRMRKKDGSLIWVLDSGRKVRGADGKTVINSIILDITDKKWADEEIIKQKNFLQSLYNTMLSGVVQVTVEEAPRILNANKAAEEIFGHTLITGKNGAIDLFSLIYPQDTAYVRRAFARLQAQQGSLRYEHRIVTKSGMVRWLDVNGEKLRNEEGIEVFQLLFTDISEKKAAELNMRQEWERYRLVARNGVDAIFEYEPEEDRFNYYLQAESLGENVQKNVILHYKESLHANDYVSPEDLPKFLDVVCEARLESAEIRLKEDWHWIDIQGEAIRNGEGKITRIVGTIRNISESKRREAEYGELQQRFSLALRNSYKEVFEVKLKEDELYLLNFSDFGFTRNKVAQGFLKTFYWSVAHIIHPEEHEKFKHFCTMVMNGSDTLQNGEESYCECRQREADGQYYWRLYMMRRADWDADTLLFFIRDIDRVKREEEQTKQALKEALLAAEAANRAKSDFLSRMSHDIRTPMNAIIGMTSIAELSLGKPQKVKECLANISTASAFLLALLNDVLDMARIESGKLSLSCKPFAIGGFVDDLVSLIKAQAKEKQLNFKITMETEPEAMYIGDMLRLHQVLMNLLSNALKFTEMGGDVCFTVRRTERGAECDTLQFLVADTGIGIEKSFMEHLFDPFEQENKSGARNYGGSGLGLSIARNLVQMMNGTIRVKSKAGEGTEFAVEIPLHRLGADKYKQAAVKNVMRSPNTFNFSGKRILLAEDNEINLEIAATVLEMKHIIVDTVGDGQEAVNAFAASKPGAYDLVLMDIRMPKLDGLAAAAAIRRLERPDAAQVPIVAMTANVFREDVEKAKACGMNGYVIKPIDTESLYGVLERLIRLGGAGAGVWEE